MRVKCQPIMEGPGPCEQVVVIERSDGHREEVIVHSRLVEDDTMRVGHVGERGDQILIELPRESASGSWRLWVPSSSVQ